MPFDRKGDSAASMQHSGDYAAAEWRQEEALSRLKLTNAEQLAQNRLKQLADQASKEKEAGKEVIDNLIAYLLSQSLGELAKLGEEAELAGDIAVEGTLDELKTSGSLALNKLLAEYLVKATIVENTLHNTRKQHIIDEAELRSGLLKDATKDAEAIKQTLSEAKKQLQDTEDTVTEKPTEPLAAEPITDAEESQQSTLVDMMKESAQKVSASSTTLTAQKREPAVQQPTQQEKVKVPTDVSTSVSSVTSELDFASGLKQAFEDQGAAQRAELSAIRDALETQSNVRETSSEVSVEVTALTPKIETQTSGQLDNALLETISQSIENILEQINSNVPEMLKASDLLALQNLLGEVVNETRSLGTELMAGVTETTTPAVAGIREASQEQAPKPKADTTNSAEAVAGRQIDTRPVIEVVETVREASAQTIQKELPDAQSSPTATEAADATAQATPPPFSGIPGVAGLDQTSDAVQQLYSDLAKKFEEVSKEAARKAAEESAKRESAMQEEAAKAESLRKAGEKHRKHLINVSLVDELDIIKAQNEAFDARITKDRLNEINKAENLTEAQKLALAFAGDEERRRAQLDDALKAQEEEKFKARADSDIRMLEARRQMEIDTEKELLALGISRQDIINSRNAEATRTRLEEEHKAKVLAAQAANDVLAGLQKDVNVDPAVLLEAERIANEANTAAKQSSSDLENFEEVEKKRAKIKDKLEKNAHKARLKEATEIASKMFSTPENKMDFLKDPKGAIAKAKEAMDPNMSEADKNGAVLSAATGMLDDLAGKLKGIASQMGGSKAAVNTRMQGTSILNAPHIAGDYWFALSNQVGFAAGVTHKQADIINNIKTLVGQGISYNVGQRAYLDTIKDKIATTFKATDTTLLKLVRIQQTDTTAARLGMESALTTFLNKMYATTEYMTQSAETIRANLYEASALMDAKSALSFEYQVQKWMGSLHSVGFSNAEGLSAAFGKLAAGDISGITEGGYGNLLVMAANKANLSISSLLAEGIDDSETNKLFKAMVEYLAQIYDESKDSKVVQQQFANVYGLTASDLKAASNLARSTKAIEKENKDYGSMMGRLLAMNATMLLRTDLGEITENLRENLMYDMAMLYNNPVTMAMYEMANMLEQFGGGINIPFVNVYGFGLDINAKVSDLMKIATMSVPVLGGAAKMLTSLGVGMATAGVGNLALMGITPGLSEVKRGGGSVFAGLTKQSGSDTSQSGYVGNSSASDVQDKTISDATEDGNNQIAAAKEEEDDIKNKQIDDHIVQIYELLQEVVSGSKGLAVSMGNVSLGGLI